MAWSTEEQKGLLAPVAADGSFEFDPIRLNLQKHCVEVLASRDFEAPSAARYYALGLEGGDRCSAPPCSSQDE